MSFRVIKPERKSKKMSNGEKLVLHLENRTLTATLEGNSSAEALKELLREEPLTIHMRDFAGMEKVGSIGRRLPTNDGPVHAKPCDLILYTGDSFVIYYEPNSWNFTRLGRLDDITPEELRKVLGKGSVTVTLELAEEV